MNDKHYNKKWSKKMGGYIGLESDKSEYIRGQVTPQHAVLVLALLIHFTNNSIKSFYCSIQ